MHRSLRVAIDCRIEDPKQGAGSTLLSLAKALSDSRPVGQEYTFIVREDIREWLAPYIYGPCRLVGIGPTGSGRMRSRLREIRPLRLLVAKLRNGPPSVPVSDGYVESKGFDLVHFPNQTAYLTDLPSIYQPWDLQHIHYPQFFSKLDFETRECFYRAFCHDAAFVCVQTEWTRRDILQCYGLPNEKVVVIPWGSVFQAYQLPSLAEMEAVKERNALPEVFFLYPAATWPHKNHEVILRALHIVRNKYGRQPHVYFTGSSTNYRATLDHLAEEAGVKEQVHFLGFVAAQELQVMFRRATAMIFASKFEGFGLPILEAFHAGLPVLSSKATTLPEVAQDAALYFDPDAPEELAQQMITMLDNPEERLRLITEGARVLSGYSMADTARNLQELYERTADYRTTLPPAARGRSMS